MIDINELWVGDKVSLQDADLQYEVCGIDIKSNKIAVKINDKIHHFDPSELIKCDEDNKLPHKILDNIKKESCELIQAKSQFRTEIDLHFTKISNTKTIVHDAQYLEYQKRRCREFLDRAIMYQVNRVEIIHGKGAGVLSSEVRNLIMNRREVSSYYSINDGGAVRVFFTYS